MEHRRIDEIRKKRIKFVIQYEHAISHYLLIKLVFHSYNIYSPRTILYIRQNNVVIKYPLDLYRLFILYIMVEQTLTP